MRVLIIGCGYVGLTLGKRLAAEGHSVCGVRRHREGQESLIEAGIQPLFSDISNRTDLDALPGDLDWIVNLASSSKGGSEQYRSVYVQGMRNLVDWVGNRPIKKLVYTSSTSVYGQTDGTAVKETSPATPAGALGPLLLEAESILLDAARHGLPAVILRVAGIYGPGRGHLFQQYLRGEARITGEGLRMLNMIHLDDVCGAIVAALTSGRPGEIYNVVDDEPIAEIHFFRWLSETLGKWMPPLVEEGSIERKRPLTNKKVQNRKLKMELGCEFKYPTFRQGYTAEIDRLQRAGQLNIDLEPR